MAGQRETRAAIVLAIRGTATITELQAVMGNSTQLVQAAVEALEKRGMASRQPDGRWTLTAAHSHRSDNDGRQAGRPQQR
jgi:Mn-dependent DtxR family transcriptional regulator